MDNEISKTSGYRKIALRAREFIRIICQSNDVEILAGHNAWAVWDAGCHSGRLKQFSPDWKSLFQ